MEDKDFIEAIIEKSDFSYYAQNFKYNSEETLSENLIHLLNCVSEYGFEEGQNNCYDYHF